MEFDYIIVGAGSAGCVLADRLTAGGKHSVLILEAGGSDNRFWIKTPIGYGKTFYDDSVNWMYQTEADPGINHQRSYWPRGKVVGGSSSINAMVYIRGQAEDYNDWRDLGNPGWGWNDVLPYFRKSETNSDGGDEFRGDQGPLYVNNVSRDYHPLCKTFVEASQQYGFNFNPDFNGASQEGVGFYQINSKNGKRMSAARAYLHPANKRDNCHLKIRAHVSKVLFNGKVATGVEYQQHGKLQRAFARREVILSGGSINSPQLLQLSGIGNKALLKQHGIEVIHHAPAVGENLQDHLGYSHYYKSKVPTLNNQLSPWWGKLLAGMQYLLTQRGVLSLSVNQAGGFVKSNLRRARPNLQLYFAAITYNTAPPDERPLMMPDPYPGFLNCIGQLRPLSRGSLHINSTDPFQAPLIKPNYLSAAEDVEEMQEGFKLLRAMAKTPAFSAIIESEMKPGLSIHSNDEIIADIRQRSTTVFHPTSTCTMGANSKTAVVDSAARVYGVEKLRVIDASIFPSVISGNTNAPTIMLAEKLADSILAEND